MNELRRINFFQSSEKYNKIEFMKQEEQILRYVSNSENLTDAKEGLMCGDGRYSKNSGRAARFGASGGLVYGLMELSQEIGANLTPEQAVMDVLEASPENIFYMHTSCGHLANPTKIEYTSFYKLDPSDADRALHAMNALSEKWPDSVENVEIKGPHLEDAVIFNIGNKVKIAHRNGDEQYFMVDKERELEYSRKVFGNLQKIITGLNKVGFNDFREKLDKQTMATAKILAKNLPIYEVNVDDYKNPMVKFMGVVK